MLSGFSVYEAIDCSTPKVFGAWPVLSMSLRGFAKAVASAGSFPIERWIRRVPLLVHQQSPRLLFCDKRRLAAGGLRGSMVASSTEGAK